MHSALTKWHWEVSVLLVLDSGVQSAAFIYHNDIVYMYTLLPPNAPLPHTSSLLCREREVPSMFFIDHVEREVPSMFFIDHVEREVPSMFFI